MIAYGYAFYRSLNPFIVFDPGFYFTPQLELVLKTKGQPSAAGQQASVLETLTLPIVWPPITGSSVFNFTLPSQVSAALESNGQLVNPYLVLSFALVPSEGVSSVPPLTVGELSFEPIVPPAATGEFELILPITSDQENVSVVLPPSLIAAYNNLANEIIAAEEAGGAEESSATGGSSVSSGGTAPSSGAGSPASGAGLPAPGVGSTGSAPSSGGSPSSGSGTGAPGGSSVPASGSGFPTSGSGFPASGTGLPAPSNVITETASEPGIIESFINAIDDAVVAINEFFTEPFTSIFIGEPTDTPSTPSTIVSSSGTGGATSAGSVPGTTVLAPAGSTATSPVTSGTSGSTATGGTGPTAPTSGTTATSPSGISATAPATSVSAPATGDSTGFFDNVFSAIDTAVTSITGFFIDPIVTTVTSISDSINIIATNLQPTVYRDLGDAPAPGNGGNYPSLLVDNGSRHKITFPLYLGYLVDVEPDSLQVDDDNFDDGFESTTWLIKISNNSWTEGPIYLNMLIDLNHDGDWDESDTEWAVKNQQVIVPAGTSKTVLPLISNLLVGLNFPITDTWIRLTVTATPVDAPYIGTGSFMYGESEDYFVTIKTPPPPAKASVYNSGVPAVKLPGKLVGDIVSEVVIVTSPTADPGGSPAPKPSGVDTVNQYDHQIEGSFWHSYQSTYYEWKKRTEVETVSAGKAPGVAPAPAPAPTPSTPGPSTGGTTSADRPPYDHQTEGSFWHSYSDSYYRWKNTIEVPVSTGKPPVSAPTPAPTPTPTPAPTPAPTPTPGSVRPDGFKYTYHVFNSSDYVPGVYHIGETTDIKYTDPGIEKDGYRVTPLPFYCADSSSDSDNCTPPKPIAVEDLPSVPSVDTSKPLITPVTVVIDEIPGGAGSDVLTAPSVFQRIFDSITEFLSVEPATPSIHDTILSIRIKNLRDTATQPAPLPSPIVPIEPTPGPKTPFSPTEPPYVVPPVVIPSEPGFFDRLKELFSFGPEIIPSKDYDLPGAIDEEMTRTIYTSPDKLKCSGGDCPGGEQSVIQQSPAESQPIHQVTLSGFERAKEGVTEVFNSAVEGAQKLSDVIFQDIRITLNPEIAPLTQENLDAQRSLFSTESVSEVTVFGTDYSTVVQREIPTISVTAETPLVVQRIVQQDAINKLEGIITQPTTVIISPIEQTFLRLQQSLQTLNESVQKFADRQNLVVQQPLVLPTDAAQITPDKILVDGKLVDQSLAEIAAKPNQCWLSSSNDGTKVLLNIEVNGTTPTGQIASADAVAEGYDDFNNVVFREVIGGRPISGTASADLLVSYYSQPRDSARISNRVLSLVPTPTFFGGSGIPAYKRVSVKLIGRNGTNCADSNSNQGASGASSIQNPAGGAGQTVLSITPAATCGAVTVLPATLPDGSETPPLLYNQTVSASNAGGSTFTFAVTAGSLPNGLSLDANTGVITGTPTRADTFNFTITATPVGDCSATTGSRAYTIVVLGGGA
ncbi:MAG: hypothetical protein G01um10143_395 [Parcubacteria group bacterium Gr01-1014_3]|nr:MAG: hypothetical protein G01um10143_395 [Parcubacteria group bacterium Gr01-1014_3]